MSSVDPSNKISNMSMVLETPALETGVRSEDGLVDRFLTFQRMLSKDQDINSEFCSMTICLWQAHLIFLA